MTEAEWLTCQNLDLLWSSYDRKPSDRKCVLFAAACSSSFRRDSDEESESWLRHMARLKAAEEFADGAMTSAEVRRVWGEPCIGGHPERAYQWASAWGKERRGLPDNPPSEVIGRILRDIFGNPFRPITLNPSWLTSTVHSLATGIYEEKAFDRMLILADALQDAGCDNEDILNHCRQPGEHVRGCWALDLVLGKT